MTSAEGNSTPPDPPLADEEVDRLLREAEALTLEISKETGVETRDQDTLPPGADSEVPLDAEAAAENAKSQVQELASVLSDDEVNKLIQGAVEASEAEEPPSDAITECMPESGLNVEHAPTSDDLPGSDPGASAAGLAPLTSQATESDPESPIVSGRDDPPQAAKPGPAAPEANASERTTPEPGDSEKDPAESEQKQARKKVPLRARIKTSIRFARRCGATALFALPNACLGTLILLDRPFAGLTATTKRRIGLIGIITVVMGILSFVLPMLLSNNPYEDIEPYLP